MIKTIVAALDSSEPSLRAVDLAAELASQTGAALHLVHVVPNERLPYGLGEFARTEHIDNPETVELELAQDKVLKPAQARAKKWPCKTVETAVLKGDPVLEVLGYAKRHRAEIIFAGRRGLGRVQGLLLGSFSAKLTQLADCAVTTVK